MTRISFVGTIVLLILASRGGLAASAQDEALTTELRTAQSLDRWVPAAEPWVEPTAEFDPFLAEEGAFVDKPIERYKRGFFQRLEFSGGWLVPFENDIETRHLAASLSVAVPLGNLENILVVTPSFRVDQNESSLALEIPNELYTTGLGLLYRREWNDRWSTLLLGEPQLRTDFESSENEVRIFALALAQWQWIPDVLELSFGAVYLGRDDLPAVLPAAGVVWRPTPEWTFEAIFPRPRIAYRLAKESDQAETWAYLQGALGGNTWNVKRSSGAEDRFSAKDYRAMLGIERVLKGGGGVFVETGYVFGRHVEYEIGLEEQDLSDGWTIQGGIRF